MRPSTLVTASVTINGQPFSFDERRHLVRVYDTEAKEMVLKCGRQVEKSTTGSISLALFEAMHPATSSIYVAPLRSQANFFSRQRFHPIVRDLHGPMANRLVRDSHQHSVEYRTYKGDRYIVFVHGQDKGNAVRGYSSDYLVMDELQSHDADAIPVVEETQSHSAYKRRLYAGTPLSNQNALEHYWRRSNQCEWFVRCSSCGMYQVMGEQNIQKDAVVCCRCGKPLNRTAGAWVAANQDSRMLGFRISQLMVPWVTPEELYKKMVTYPRHQFYNEVLGLSYDSAMVPFPMSSFIPPRVDYAMECLDTLEHTPWNLGETFAGVDWGTGSPAKTVLTIGGYTEEGVLRILKIKYFLSVEEMNMDRQVDMIAEMLKRYRVRQCFVDYGAGLVQATKLRSAFGNQVMMVQYVNTTNANRRGKPWKINSDAGIIQIRKAHLLTDLQIAHDHCLIRYPGASGADLDRLKTDMSNEYVEYRKYAGSSASEEIYFDHPAGSTDDGLHSLAYMWLAAKMTRSNALMDAPSVIRANRPMSFGVA